MPLSKVQSNSISDSAITSSKISDGAVTASDLNATAITDKLGFTPISNTTSGSFGVAVSPSSQVPNSLQFSRIGNRYTAGGGMNGSTWVNTGIILTQASPEYMNSVYALVDAIGNENGRNQGIRRFFILMNAFDGTSISQIYSYNQGNNYGLVDIQMSGYQIQVKAANNASGGPWRLYVQEYII